VHNFIEETKISSLFYFIFKLILAMPLRTVFTLELIALRGGPEWFTEVSKKRRNLDVPGASTNSPSAASTPLSVSPAHGTSRVHLGPASVVENPPSAAVQVLTTNGVLITHVSCFDHSTPLVDHVPAVGASAPTSSPPLDRMQGNPNPTAETMTRGGT
jgi:hypothetical protein